MLSPVLGSFAFVVLYVLAAFFYPGGSAVDVRSKGFSWMHNYWCNLMNEKALNGEINAARPFAYAAMLVVAITLWFFWYIASQRLSLSRNRKILVLFSGSLSLVLLPLLPTTLHDAVINVSASLGLVAMFVIYAALYKKAWNVLFSLGVFNVLLVALNNYLYYGTSLYYLPLVQKITFVSFLLWVVLVTGKIYREQSAT